MKKTSNNTLSIWREEGRHLIQENFEVFRNLVTQTRDLTQRGEYGMAAVYARIAAWHAQWRHCGLFVSPELESILLTIGRRGIRTRVYSPEIASSLETPKSVLHVSTNVSIFSGIPRFIRRWMLQDARRSHSLALTMQAPAEVPAVLRDAVSSRDGRIYVLNKSFGSLMSRARRLREIAATADMVVLHTFDHDVIPSIALADRKNLSTIFVNHSDHGFWLGASISDAIANLRESGMRLSGKRRGIEACRNLLLPTVLEPTHRTLERASAKRQLGIDGTKVLLLSIARAPKYRTIDGSSFADAHAPLLKQHDEAVLIVIGPQNTTDWSSAIEQTNGRIRVLRETEETAVFYQAADIYVDSFPWVSNTSLLEAGSYGMPLVSRYPFSSNACEVLGADMPGLTGNLIRVRDIEEYTSALSRLIKDKEYRLSLGDATRKKIVETHTGSQWQGYLDDLYLRAAIMSRATAHSDQRDQMFIGEPDVFLQKVLGQNVNLEETFSSNLKLMPLGHRLRNWLKLSQSRGYRLPFSLMLPEWLYYHYLRLAKQTAIYA